MSLWFLVSTFCISQTNSFTPQNSYVCIKFHLSSADTPRPSLNTFHTLKATEIFTRSLAVSFNTSHIHFHSARHASATSFETFDIHTRPGPITLACVFAASSDFIKLLKPGEKAEKPWKHLKCVFTFTVL